MQNTNIGGNVGTQISVGQNTGTIIIGTSNVNKKNFLLALFDNFNEQTFYPTVARFYDSDTTKELLKNYNDVSLSKKDVSNIEAVDTPNKTNAVNYYLSKLLRGEIQDKFFILLGDSGMGKTSVLTKLCFKLQQKQFFTRSKKGVIYYSLSSVYQTSFIEEIERINVETKRNTVLLLDSLDEDEGARVNLTERVNNIIHATKDFYKVVVASRTHFFSSLTELPTETGIFNSVDSTKQYKIDIAYLLPFDSSDINRFINKKYKWYNFSARDKKKVAIQLINNSEKLISRPLLLYYLDELIESSIKKGRINYASSYDIYAEVISKWVERETKRIVQLYIDNSNQDILNIPKFRNPATINKEASEIQACIILFLKALAIELYFNNNVGYKISRPKISDLLKAYKIDISKSVILSKNELYLDLIFKSRTLLSRNDEGKYKFSHYSIYEYFIAHILYNINILKDETFIGSLKMDYKSFNFNGFEKAEEFFDHICWNGFMEKFVSATNGECSFDLKNWISIRELEDDTFDFKDIKGLSINVATEIPVGTFLCFRHLETLILRNSNINDISFLGEALNIKVLDLSGTRIQYFEPLLYLPNLRHLDVTNTLIDSEEVNRIKEKLPRCNVLYSDRLENVHFLRVLAPQKLLAGELHIEDHQEFMNSQMQAQMRNQTFEIRFGKDINPLLIKLKTDEYYSLDFKVEYITSEPAKFYANLRPDIEYNVFENPLLYMPHLSNEMAEYLQSIVPPMFLSKAAHFDNPFIEGRGMFEFTLSGYAPHLPGKYSKIIDMGLLPAEDWTKSFVHLYYGFHIEVKKADNKSLTPTAAKPNPQSQRKRRYA